MRSAWTSGCADVNGAVWPSQIKEPEMSMEETWLIRLGMVTTAWVCSDPLPSTPGRPVRPSVSHVDFVSGEGTANSRVPL